MVPASRDGRVPQREATRRNNSGLRKGFTFCYREAVVQSAIHAPPAVGDLRLGPVAEFPQSSSGFCIRWGTPATSKPYARVARPITRGVT